MIDLAGKEIINIYDGARLGIVGDSDLLIDSQSGNISAIIIPRRSNLVNFWVDKQSMIIPWESVKKIGSEIIIVDLDQTNLNLRKYMA